MRGVIDLAADWREFAVRQREVGAVAQAFTLDWCAEKLEERSLNWERETLTLKQAAEESGYSRDHLGRLLASEILPNAGEPYAPRIRRRDLPRKPGHLAEPVSPHERSLDSKLQMARSVVESD